MLRGRTARFHYDKGAVMKVYYEKDADLNTLKNKVMAVFEDAAKELGKIPFLAQGTIYPDVIESGDASAATIKSHHNVGGLPENIGFEGLIEPLRGLFKDEVRAIGRSLGLPDDLVET